MIEASLWIAHAKKKIVASHFADSHFYENGKVLQVDAVELTEEEQEWFERCPCGENHDVVVIPIPEPG
jgi:hypothetical protein